MLDSSRMAEAALERDDPLELMDWILELAAEGDDRALAENCCARLARHRNAMVRGNAMLGFGHLARRFGRLDAQRIKRLVDTALHDGSDYVREQARSAAEDLRTFLAWEFESIDGESNDQAAQT
ncbi:MAG: hypothetical protein JRF15_14545 [Deltaproteobacteria bacterium]|nr:hypothetical protein [Deltaproteobacteria bacterium]